LLAMKSLTDSGSFKSQCLARYFNMKEICSNVLLANPFLLRLIRVLRILSLVEESEEGYVILEFGPVV